MNFIGGKTRMEAFQKLKVFLKNPGRFCLIVIGSRGTGKHYAIQCAFKEISLDNNKELCLENLEFIEPKNFPIDEKEIDEFLGKFENKTLVIEDVENLSSEQEKLLFKALSTTDGRFGINKKINTRIVFTSSQDCDSLREDGKYLTGLFWDRISQLLVEFPSYKQESEYIVRDFHSTWEKMKFKNIEEYKALSNLPKNIWLENFLENNAEKFDGGFRDLDKLACMYFNYRIYHYCKNKKIDERIEKLVVESVKSDFFSKSQMHGSTGNDKSIFQFEIGLNHQELLGKYKVQLRCWAVKEYGTVKRAEEKLGFKPGTMKNYVKDKVTKMGKSKQ